MCKYFGLDMEQYRDAKGDGANNPTTPTSTGGKYVLDDEDFTGVEFGAVPVTDDTE